MGLKYSLITHWHAFTLLFNKGFFVFHTFIKVDLDIMAQNSTKPLITGIPIAIFIAKVEINIIFQHSLTCSGIFTACGNQF